MSAEQDERPDGIDQIDAEIAGPGQPFEEEQVMAGTEVGPGMWVSWETDSGSERSGKVREVLPDTMNNTLLVLPMPDVDEKMPVGIENLTQVHGHAVDSVRVEVDDE